MAVASEAEDRGFESHAAGQPSHLAAFEWPRAPS